MNHNRKNKKNGPDEDPEECYVCGITEEMIYDSEEDEFLCETCIEAREMQDSSYNSEEEKLLCEACLQGRLELPSNSEESVSSFEEDEYKCVECIQH